MTTRYRFGLKSHPPTNYFQNDSKYRKFVNAQFAIIDGTVGFRNI